jgi:hypothetical protein
MADTKDKEPQSRDQLTARLSLEARDLPAILLCLLGAAFCFGMFWADFNRTMERLAEPIGTITYKRQAAQRRFADRVLWIRLSRGAPVYQGDYIRTAELSQATMHFKDGADIDLAENTLIQLRIEGGKNLVDLSEGNLSLAVSAPAFRILVSGENRVELGAGAVVSASADPSGVFTMQVLEGKVTANGKTFAAGEGFSTGITTLPARPPAAKAAPKTPPQTAAGPAPKPSGKTTRPSGTVVSDFPVSRVPDTPRLTPSPLSPDSPSPLPPPSGMDPPDRFTVGPEMVRRNRRMVFSWNGVEGANSYIFSVFEETAGNSGDVLFRAETAETFYILEDLGLLGNGAFVWQVEAVEKSDIERRGTPGKSRFTIDVPAPGNPRVRETGALYGL